MLETPSLVPTAENIKHCPLFCVRRSLCNTAENSASGTVAEYALRDVGKPIDVSTYRVTKELPDPVRDELPTVEALQEVVAKLRAERAISGMTARKSPDGKRRRSALNPGAGGLRVF